MEKHTPNKKHYSLTSISFIRKKKQDQPYQGSEVYNEESGLQCPLILTITHPDYLANLVSGKKNTPRTQLISFCSAVDIACYPEKLGYAPTAHGVRRAVFNSAESRIINTGESGVIIMKWTEVDTAE